MIEQTDGNRFHHKCHQLFFDRFKGEKNFILLDSSMVNKIVQGEKAYLGLISPKLRSLLREMTEATDILVIDVVQQPGMAWRSSSRERAPKPVQPQNVISHTLIDADTGEVEARVTISCSCP